MDRTSLLYLTLSGLLGMPLALVLIIIAIAMLFQIGIKGLFVRSIKFSKNKEAIGATAQTISFICLLLAFASILGIAYFAFALEVTPL